MLRNTFCPDKRLCFLAEKSHPKLLRGCCCYEILGTLFVAICHYCHYLPLFATICHYLPLFATIYHYLPLFATICHYLPLFATIRHYSRLFATIRTIRTIRYWLFGTIRCSLFATIRYSLFGFSRHPSL